MATESTQFDINVPNLGKVPVQLNYDRERGGTVITHRPPEVGADPYVRFLSEEVVLVPDPGSKIPQYAVRRQKLVTLTKELLNRLLKKELLVATASGKDENSKIERELDSVNEDPARRVIGFDCPEVGKGIDEAATFLLHWDEEDTPDLADLLLFDPATRSITRLDDDKQTYNFLLSGVKDPNSPPVHPPWASVSPLNTQPSDFRTATDDDIAHYAQFNGQDERPAVAVLDTGLKYNIRNLGEEDQWPNAYKYQDADGKEQQFWLANQDQAQTDCGPLLTDNLLGYCSLQAYRQPEFPKGLSHKPTDYTPAKAANSPFDDCRLFNDTAGTTMLDARHGTSITALIQQHGENAPVLPVKAFDNMAFTTLFDVLNGFNYILHRRESANIRVVNASWICTRDEPRLREKIRQLMEVGVFVVAAAGNEGQTTNRNLDDAKVYPACYSTELPNVITVTSVRKSYLPPDLISRRGDSIINNLLGHAIEGLGLFGLLEGADDVLDALLPTGGYVAVENYSTTFVNVGVVSTFGYFRSPFWTGDPVRGSSFACAFVSAFVIRQLTKKPTLLPAGNPVTEADRQQLLDAMSGTDKNLMSDYVAGGYYLAGYDVD